AGGVHEYLGADFELFSSQFVAHQSRGQSASRIAQESGHARMVERLSAAFRKRFHQREVVARVVELPVGVGNRAAQAFRTEIRHSPQGFFPRKEAARKEIVLSREPVVKLKSGAVVSRLRP